MSWQTPITDRTVEDTVYARNNQSNVEHNKGAWNYNDLNRIEENYKYIIEKLNADSYHIPHTDRNYTETEASVEKWIQSSGTQYIDTKVKPNQDTKIIVDFICLSSNSDPTIFGAWDGQIRNAFVFLSTSGRSGGHGFYGTQMASYDKNMTLRHTIIADKNSWTLDGETILSFSNTTFSCNNSIYLFAYNNAGTVGNLQSSIRIYSCKIYDGNVLVREFAPVKDDNGKACIYDKVTQTYFYNVGIGDFLYGENVSNTKQPTTYTDWHEKNIPYKSEIDRIRRNHNNMVSLFLHGLGLPEIPYNNYLDYEEANMLETIELRGKEMFENMQKSYIPCGTITSGGDLL